MTESSKTKDKFLAACIHNILLVPAYYGIYLHVSHIRVTENIMAYILARLHSDKGVDDCIVHDWRKLCSLEKEEMCKSA